MSAFGRNLTRLAVAASAVAALGVAVPSTPAAAASATVCGTGYEFVDAKALPSATNRSATLFFYMKGNSACAILDNNTTGGANYMDLQMWPGDNKAAGERDKGNFSEYAGPVHSSTLASGGRCVGISALMKNEAGTANLFNWTGGYVFSVDNSSSECA
ncbi:hypothetical protein SAMN06272735_5150 [Streptomyces sp. TLI_55]|uniref:Spore-associated protein A n=1 Tax=Streptomyces aquilus TaxID=2548456 RepID=A0A3S9I5X6_9ACTN|nr:MULTISPECIES: hypothetical protein [Streptomyces]AZP19765.1 hypothetical protein EJC51_29075 [Streptomyces aquilus]SNX63342.1 hypothetical protein SAMN06272735_5150 [Streptomyces sp. TLI_55]